MDPDIAQVLFKNGATLVLLDVPLGTEFGVDYNTWTTDVNFKGIKMIPPGLHFIYYSSVGKLNDVSPRTGFFHIFQKKEVLIKKWDNLNEDFVDVVLNVDVDEELIEKQKQDYDRFLGAYPYETYKKWISLTNHISSDMIQKLQPLNKKIYSVAMFESVSTNSQTRAAQKENAEKNTGASEIKEDLPEMKHIHGTNINFTNLTKLICPKGASPTEITKFNMDLSHHLDNLINNIYCDELNILGELQFCFIVFILCQVYDAFEQWKQLVHIICSCDAAIEYRETLFLKFISVLNYQILEIPDDFFVDIVTANNFLTITLQTFFQ